MVIAHDSECLRGLAQFLFPKWQMMIALTEIAREVLKSFIDYEKDASIWLLVILFKTRFAPAVEAGNLSSELQLWVQLRHGVYAFSAWVR